MNDSLRALLSGIVDYAGLFPPAKLTLDAALTHFSTDRAGHDSWMLSRFVIPAARLGELAPYHALFAEGARVPLTILGRGGNDRDGFLAGFDRDLGDLEMFLGRVGTGAGVDACEVKVPLALLEPPDPAVLLDLFVHVEELLEAKSPVPLTVYYEGTYGPDWHRSIGAVVSALGTHRASRAAGTKAKAPGFKLRTGGTESTAFPPVEQVALVIASCRDAKVPFKATAGLHHPVRHLDHELLAKVHGFLNVFCGAALAHARGLDELTLAEVIADEDPRAFVFDGATFRWRDQSVSAAEIGRARAELAHSFGSCSFDEPRRDLAALGLF